MAARAPRSGRCPAGRAARLTRTQIMREAKNAAIVQREARPENPQGGPCPARSRTSLAKRGPPPAPPKKIDFARPAMTKAMEARRKLAAEKVQRAAEADRRREEASGRCPRRTPAPVGGDARLSRQRSNVGERKSPDRQAKALQDAIDRGHIVTERGGHRPKKSPRGARSSSPMAVGSPIAEDAKELARSMNAEVVQAVPMDDGPVDKIIIEPGAIRNDRSTIVCIASPGDAAAGPSDIANRSIQVISETLDEQDAVESAAVQGKLEELQNARREFVMAVANVGGNAVNIHDDSGESILNIDELGDQLDYLPSPPRPRRIVRMPDISHEMFMPEYGPDHPNIEAARKFSKRQHAVMEQRDAQRRIEAEFERYANHQADDLDFTVPLEQDLQEGDISWEEDEEGHLMPCPSRVKASMPIPRRTGVCPANQRGANIEEIERFFDLQRHPPPACPAAPPGREGLHPDLWDIDDPWYFEESRAESPPLMRFDSPC